MDEAHGYKNLRLASNIPGVAVDGSNRATDLDLKMSYLRGRHGRRVATFMTATPIANSVAEAYTMLRYLAPADLEAAGISDFDTWAATFGQVVTDLELSPSGTGFRMKARFAKFNNVPELLRLWHQVADVKTADDLSLPTPDLEGGAPETVVVPPSQELVDFMALLAQRADAVSSRAVDPSEDNMLKISGHGRAAARGQILLVLLPGLAQVHVKVDEARRDPLGRSVHHLGAFGAQIGTHLDDPAFFDQHVRHGVMVD